MGLRVGERAEVASHDLCAVDPCKKRSLSRPTLRQALHPECGVERSDDVMGAIVCAEGGVPRLVVRKPAEARTVGLRKRIRFRGGPDAESVQEEKKNVLRAVGDLDEKSDRRVVRLPRMKYATVVTVVRTLYSVGRVCL